MFSLGANDPRATVPPNARDSTSRLPSDGGGLWDIPSHIKDTKLERGDREKILLGRMNLVSNRAFVVPSRSYYERHDRERGERIFGGNREWFTSKRSSFSTKTTDGPKFSNGISLSTLSKPYPGVHGVYKEKSKSRSSLGRDGDTLHAFLPDNYPGGGRDCDLYVETSEAASGSKDTNLVHRTEDLGLHMDDGTCFKNEDKMQDFATTELVEYSLINLQHGHRASSLVNNSAWLGERDSKVKEADLPQRLGALGYDISQPKKAVYKVATEPKSGIMLNQHNGEDLTVSNMTSGSSMKHSSKNLSERAVSTTSWRSAFAVGNGFSNEPIARLQTSLDAVLLTPKSSCQSSLHCSSIGSPQSAEDSTIRKRPRLGWGQGLAKYEQKKVEGNISSLATVGAGGSELTSLSTYDEHTTLITTGHLTSMASFGGLNYNPEGRQVLEISAELQGEVSCQNDEGEKNHNEELGTSNQTCISQEQASFGKTKRVESSQLQVEQVPSCNSADPLVLDKQNEDFSASHKSLTHELLPFVENAVESDYCTPIYAFGWTKQDILDGVEKLELEIDLVEKELLKLDLDGEGNLQKTLTASLANKTECHIQQRCCFAVRNLEKPCMSKGTLTHQEHPDESQALHSPFETLVGCQIEQSPDKRSDACVQTRELEDEHKLILGHDINNLVSQEIINEDEICDGNECTGTKILFVTVESFPSSDALRNDFLLDMQKLHLQSVHALLEENQVQSRKASNPFDYLLPENLPTLDNSHLASDPDVSKQEYNQNGCDAPKEQILQSLARHKQLVRFKEQALALKYRILKELWRQEQLGNCIKKDPSLPFGKYECEQKGGAAFATQWFSSRLPPTLSGKLDASFQEGELQRKAIADLCDEQVRSFLKMPAMALEKKERIYNKLVSTNGLVEDPISLEQERETMNPWNLEEKQIFLEKFAAFNKNFSKIASYLENKTTADCVVFYYKNHKSEDFEKIRQRHHLKKRRDCSRFAASYLATTIFPAGSHREGKSVLVEGINHNASRGILRHETSELHKSTNRIHVTGPSELISGEIKKSTWTKERKAASNLLAVAAGMASGDVMNPCSSSTPVFPPKCGISSELLGEGSLDQVSFRRKTTPFGDSKAIKYVNGQTVNGKSTGEQQWSDNEKHFFIDALSLYGKDFKRISQYIKTKTQGQCKSFFSKSRKRLDLDQILGRSETGSRASSEAKLVPMQPNNDTETVKGPELVVHTNAFTSPESLFLEESPSTYLEATMKQSQLPVLDAQTSTKNIKLVPEDDKNTVSLNDQGFVNPHQHTLASSPTSHRTERMWEKNELHCTQAVCESSLSTCLSKTHINEMHVLEGEGCSGKTAKKDDVNIEHIAFTLDTEVVQDTVSALNNEASVDIATTSCTSSSGVILTEPEPLYKRSKLEADSLSISSSILPEYQLSHDVKPLKAIIAVKNIQLQEKAVKVGGETRNRREATSWTPEEKEIFAETLRQDGKDWTLLQERLPLKYLTQIKTYFQNSKAKLGYGSEHIGNGSGQGFCSRKRKADVTDTLTRSLGKSNSQKAGQLPGNDGALKLNSSSMGQNAVSSAEQLAELTRNSGQVVEDIVVMNDIQKFLKQLSSSGLHTSTTSSKKLSAGDISEVAPNAVHVLGTMQGQMLSRSLHASKQQQPFSSYKQPSTCYNNQQQALMYQRLQVAQSVSKQQPTQDLCQQQAQVIHNQQELPSAFQQPVSNDQQPLSIPLQVSASSFPSQNIAHQFSYQHAYSSLATPRNDLLYNQIAHQFQQPAAHKQQQKQVIGSQQRFQQAHQMQNVVLPVAVLQHDLPGSATNFHNPILPTHQQSPPHLVSNQQNSLVKQQQDSQLLNQPKAVHHQDAFSSQQQQTVSTQHILIQHQKQLQETPLAQIAQHQLLHQRQLKNIVLQQRLHILGQAQDHHNDMFSPKLLRHLRMKENQQPLQQHNPQTFSSEGSKTTARQFTNYVLDNQTQTLLTAASVQGTLPGLGSSSDIFNPSDFDRKRPLVPKLSLEDSQSSHPDSEVSVRTHSRGGTCSERQLGGSGDVKLFGQSLLVQPSSLCSKSCSVSPTGSGSSLLKSLGPSMSASPASASVSSMLPPPKFLGSGSVTSCSLDKETHHSPGHETLHHGSLLATSMANGTLSKTAVLESPRAIQESSCWTQRPVQTRILEHGTYGQSVTTLSEHAEVCTGSRQTCRDEKYLHTISGPVKGQSEQQFTAFPAKVSVNQLDGVIGYNHTKVDERKLAGKSGGKAAQILPNISYQGLSHGVLSAIKAITTRQNFQNIKCTVGTTQVDDHGSLGDAKDLEAPKGSGLVEVPNFIGRSHISGHDILQHVLQSYLSSSQMLNIQKQPVSYDNVCTRGGSHVVMTDNLELVPKHLAAQSTYQESLKSLDSQEVNSTGSSR